MKVCDVLWIQHSIFVSFFTILNEFLTAIVHTANIYILWYVYDISFKQFPNMNVHINIFQLINCSTVDVCVRALPVFPFFRFSTRLRLPQQLKINRCGAAVRLMTHTTQHTGRIAIDRETVKKGFCCYPPHSTIVQFISALVSFVLYVCIYIIQRNININTQPARAQSNQCFFVGSFFTIKKVINICKYILFRQKKTINSNS